MQISVNRDAHEVAAGPQRSLLVVLREELGLTAAKYGCGEGACGACTVLLDGAPVRSCQVPIGEVGSRTVTTLEGLASDPTRIRLGDAFTAAGASQCGYCTPGMLVSATALLHAQDAPEEAAMTAAMDGNLCRCGTYRRILAAIGEAAAHRTRTAREVSGVAPARELPEHQFEPTRPWDLTPASDREWFGVLGEGLVVLLGPEEVERALRSSGRGWSTPGGAWIHIGNAGEVTAFTGKVDVGQHNGIALASLVAAELGIAPSAVRTVMGDTDVCPEDLGTFGSRSMADAGTLLAAAARETRSALIRLAATAWEAAPADLQLAAGAVVSRDGARRASFGELVRGRRDVEVAHWDGGLVMAPLPADTAHSGAAAAEPGDQSRSDRSLVAYTSDLALPAMLHGRVLRPTVFGALLQSVDIAAAERVPGVTVVRDGDFVGVVALDPTAAAQALEAIVAEWDLATDRPSDADLDEWLVAHPVDAEGWDGNLDRTTGDVEQGLARSSLTLTAMYRTAFIAHVPLETRAAVARWDEKGRVTVWTGTQRPFGVREQVADALGIATDRVRVIVPPTGSGYGGKHSGDAAVEAARLAKAVDRPVKVRWTRAEEFTEAYLRPAAVINVRCGLDADGHLLAWEMRNVNAGANALMTPYEVPNQHHVFQATEAPLRQGSYRALAATANTFAREVQMDELAAAADQDPVAFRVAHLRDERLVAVLRAAADAAGWNGTANTEDGEGVGIALGFEKDGRIATCVRLRVDDPGQVRITRIVSAYDCGRIVDRENLANQVEGAAVMGLGGALFERIGLEHGRITNPSLNSYRVPRFTDVPPIEVVLLDQPDQPSVGAGETPIIAIAPAISNAIFAASGRRLRSLPLLSAEGTLPS